MNVKRILGIAMVIGLGLFALGLSEQIVETNIAGFRQIKQAAITGDLTCRLEPGMYLQLFGKIHTYSEAETFFFTADDETGEKRNQSLPTRFNDGAKAQTSGSLRVILPQDCAQLISLHRKFHSSGGVKQKLVLPAVRKALFNTGPHMSAGESYAERRGEFAMLAEDQLKFGVIMVDKFESIKPDPITGIEKTTWTLTKRACSDLDDPHCIGGYVRDPSPFFQFGIDITNFVIDGIAYPDAVLEQIEAQRKARMNIITQQAEAKEADARAAKAESEARAQIAETRAAEEVKKTQIVVAAEAARDKAVLDAESAELEKQANISRGEGEAARRRLVMQADGALDKKLNAYITAQQAWARAYATRPVPTMVMGGGGGDTDKGSSDFSQAMQLLVAKELGLDLSVNNNN